MQKRVVILGGVGLLGSHLARRILDRGESLYVVDTREPCSSKLLHELSSHENFHYVHHNIASPFTIRCDEIYNLCAPTRLGYDKQPPVESLKTYLQGAINTLENARSEFSRVVYASSSLLYNSYYESPEEPFSERRACSEGIRAAEVIHQAYFNEYGTDTRIARLFNLYGSGADLNDRRVVMRMVCSALRGREIIICGSGEQMRSFLWVEDAADALIRLMQAKPSHSPLTIDLGSEEEISIRALAEKIISLTGSSSKIRHIESRHGEVKRKIPNLKPAMRELHWRPSTPLDEGLKRLIEYVELELSAYTHGCRNWVETFG